MPTAPTFATGFDPRRNSLNALRLGLAIAVIVSHSWPIGGYGADPNVGGSDLGTWAVAGFFGISGYLITASRFSSRGLFDYLWRRFLRIYPAFLAALLLVGVVLAPLSQLFGRSPSFSMMAGLHYVGVNLGLLIHQYGIPGTLQGAPYPAAWNGSLWTLIFEAGCYVMVGVVVSLLRRRLFVIVFLAVVLAAGEVLNILHVARSGGGAATGGILAALQLVPIFVGGGLIYLLRDRIRMSPWLAALAGVALVGGVALHLFPVVAPIACPYLALWLGAVLPLHRIGARNDISYGMYVYAFPLQQLLVLLGATVLPVWLFAMAATALTVPVAFASWLALERPAMRLKSLTARKTPDREGHVLVAP